MQGCSQWDSTILQQVWMAIWKFGKHAGTGFWGGGLVEGLNKWVIHGHEQRKKGKAVSFMDYFSYIHEKF